MMKCKKIIPILMLLMLATGCQGGNSSASNPHPSEPGSQPQVPSEQEPSSQPQVSLPTPSEDDPTSSQPEPSIPDSEPGVEVEGPWI